MVEKIVLKNGVRLLLEHLPYVRSTSVGIWLHTGSMFENKQTNGISHFLEHMTFKGTKKRNAKEIAQAIDEVGGHLDGMTSREFTCYYAKVLDTHTLLAIDVLTDMLLSSVYADEEIAKERKVVTEEIKMYEDSPDEYIHDIFIQSIWKDHPLGRPILGNRENVAGFKRDDILKYSLDRYIPENILISIAGSFDKKIIEDNIRELYENFPASEQGNGINPPTHSPSKTILTRKDLQQVHLCLGAPGVSRIHPERFSFYILNTLLGGGMSSRLFQEVREKRGLAYSIYSYPTAYKLAGAFTVYCGTSPGNYNKLIEVVMDQFKILKDQKIPRDELTRAKEQFKGSLMLSLENTDNRMTRMAKLELYFGEVPDLDTTLKRIDSVQAGDIQKLANILFDDKKIAMAAIGPESFQANVTPESAAV